jgi:hypothetical protein
MSIWQCDFHLIPRRSLVEHFNSVPRTMTKALFGAANWWKGLGYSANGLAALDVVLPRKESWSPDLWQWGTDESDRVDAIVENDEIASLLVRADVRAPRQRIVKLVETLARQFDALILTDRGDLVEPEHETLMEALEQSEARRLWRDPDRFLGEGDRSS